MQPEVSLLFNQFDAVDNDCKDALIASWGEKDPIKRNILKEIYKKKDLERAKIAKEMNKLCQIK